MREFKILIFCVIFLIAFGYILSIYDPSNSKAAFYMQSLLGVGTFSAVLFALYGDYLKEKLDPIKVNIEVCPINNNVVDKISIPNNISAARRCYHHHLQVSNKAPHKPIKNCSVWLKRIEEKSFEDKWIEPMCFAVPRRMEWAPSEFERGSRTFVSTQIFDLGRTFEGNNGFEVIVDRDQKGTFQRLFGASKIIRLTFFVTAENYHQDETFVVEVEIPHVPNGDLKPAKVTRV